MARPKLTLYVDVVSPFAYIAFHILKSSPFTNVDVTFVPILLGGIMQACGNTPPINVKNKDKWIDLERKRWAAYFNVPIAEKSPEPFPQPTINAQRALCFFQREQPQHLEAAIAALFQAFWVERKPISDIVTVAAALESAVGKDTTAQALAAIKSDGVKAALKQNTDNAFADGCFGLPWFTATNAAGVQQSYWGVDHLGQVMDHLGLERAPTKGFQAVL